MNIVLLEPGDFVDADRVHLRDRRLDHVRQIHRVQTGDELRVGVLGGGVGRGKIKQLDENLLEMTIRIEAGPPSPLPVRLILALPRPKVLNRVIAAACSMGVREIDLINSWRVEKSYWESPRLSDENLRLQCILGLEQAGDTILPAIRLHRLFSPFIRHALPKITEGRLALLAHPGEESESPRNVTQPVVLAVGPEGGFIQREVDTFRDSGFTTVCLGPRILRVETAIAYFMGRLF
jgi:RsmE family RNA methyltransferase